MVSNHPKNYITGNITITSDISALFPLYGVVVPVSVSSMCKRDLFKIMFKRILNNINILVLRISILKLVNKFLSV